MKLKQIYILITVFLLMSSSAFAQISESQAKQKFMQASQLYREGQYKEAIPKYQEIIMGARESGAIYYNLANSYFKNAELGKSILNYERAKRLSPRDSDILFNHNYALNQVQAPLIEYKKGFITRALVNHAEFYTLDEMTLIVSISFVLIGIVLILRLYLKLAKGLVAGINVFVGLIFLVFSIGLVFKVQYDSQQAIILASTSSNFEPRENTTTHFKLSEGMKVKIVKTENDWAKIKRQDGKLGWVKLNKLEAI